MDFIAPSYYEEFSCIAGACPDSCCKEWAVDVDAQAAAYYRSLPGELGDRLRAVLKDEDGGTVMTITDGRCPMWRKDGLCEIQAQLGHDALCQTCRDFPRLRHDYGTFTELGLELSCPEAARLILACDTSDTSLQTVPGEKDVDYEPEVMQILLRSREEALALLNTAYSLPEKLGILLLHAHSVQAEIDGAERSPFVPRLCLQDARKYAAPGDMDALLAFFQSLEILTPQWKAKLRLPVGGDSWDDPYPALIRYFIGRYWLQAVSDYDLVGRVKFILAGCILIHQLGGNMVDTAQLFSKEIENDPDNIDAILDGAYTQPALTDANLLGLLLQ